jgi:hypothetical protein
VYEEKREEGGGIPLVTMVGVGELGEAEFLRVMGQFCDWPFHGRPITGQRPKEMLWKSALVLGT